MTGREALTPKTEAALREVFRPEPDPAFLKRLRSDTRARHARLAKNLAWFDLGFDVGPLRIVHDGELVHLVTNDPDRFRDLAGESLGFIPDRGEKPGVRASVERALAGKVRGSEIAFLGELPSFHRHVLEATARFPRGEVRPYAWVARQAGTPRAVRAAGTALAHNPVPIVVPCHRVVKSDWELGQYSAGGARVKERILTFEGLEIARLTELHARGVRYLGHGGGTFCIPGCGGAWEPVDDVRTFRSVDEALAVGYSPCSECRPA
jgi:O-6-methylguanine DNA methyltransferase